VFDDMIPKSIVVEYCERKRALTFVKCLLLLVAASELAACHPQKSCVPAFAPFLMCVTLFEFATLRLGRWRACQKVMSAFRMGFLVMCACVQYLELPGTTTAVSPVMGGGGMAGC
jgi:hypothetical protein